MSDKHVDNGTSPLEFPCRFPLKVMGRAQPEFTDLVKGIVQQHVPEDDILDISTRESRENRFLSVTVVIQATSRPQLDALYTDLTTCEQVLMAL